MQQLSQHMQKLKTTHVLRRLLELLQLWTFFCRNWVLLFFGKKKSKRSREWRQRPCEMYSPDFTGCDKIQTMTHQGEVTHF